MRGINPEEDGVDQRVEPQPWLADEAANGNGAGPDPEADQPPSSSDASYQADPDYVVVPADEDDSSRQSYPNGSSTVGSSTAGSSTADNGQPPLSQGMSVGGDLPLGEDMPMPPPYPAQMPSGRGLGARMTAPFLARSKTGAVKPARPPQGERSSRPMSARVTAPFQAKEKTGTPKPAKPTRPPAAAQTGYRPKAPQQPTRKAQLILSRIEPWSVMKFSFMVSLVGWVILFVAVSVLYFVLSKLGVFHAIQSTVGNVTSSKGSSGDDTNGTWFSASRILGYTMLIGAVNVILITALATVGAVVYNLVTFIAGGIEVTLKETD